MLSGSDKDALREIFTAEHEVLEQIESNEIQYLNEISILLDEFTHYRELKSELLDLQTRYAALNAEMYDLYMAVHSNAIVISATLAELDLKGIMIPHWVADESRKILEEFLIFKGFR